MEDKMLQSNTVVRIPTTFGCLHYGKSNEIFFRSKLLWLQQIVGGLVLPMVGRVIIWTLELTRTKQLLV